jgi:hypothetical protein
MKYLQEPTVLQDDMPEADPGAAPPAVVPMAVPSTLSLKPNFHTVTVSTAGNQQSSAVLRERDPIVVLNQPELP